MSADQKIKYALVTGGSRGIGKAVSVQLAQMGYHILLNYRSNLAAAEETAELIKSEGTTAMLLPFDVADAKSSIEILDQWKESNPNATVEVFVNNAGIRKDNLLLLMKEEDWSDVLNVNLNSFFHLSKWVMNDMLKARYGRIINMVSLSGIKGMPGQTNYSAAKAGLIGATKALAQEIAKRKITVNAVAPGFITTDMTEDIEESQFKAMIPIRRFGTAEEVASVVAFLASPGASYVTGEVISVNGALYP